MKLCFTCWWCSWNSVLFHKIFSDFYFPDQDQYQDSSSEINNKNDALCFKDTHQIWCRPANIFSKSKSCSRWGLGSGSWFYFGFQYRTYISYIEDTHQTLFGSANSFESYCVHMKGPRTYRQTDRQKFFLLVLSSTTYKTWTFVKRREFLFFTHAITILSLFTYSVCDEKVKKIRTRRIILIGFALQSTFFK